MSDTVAARWEQYTAAGRRSLSLGQLGEAEAAFRAAIREAEQRGGDSAMLSASLTALGQLRFQAGDNAGAEELFARALSVCEQHAGSTHPDVAIPLSNLAKLHFKRRDFVKADRLLLRLLEVRRALGKDHPDVAAVLALLAKVRQTVGKFEQGEQLWRQALAIRERAFAPNDPIIAATLENVADCSAAKSGRTADAIALRERALGIREQAMGSAHPSSMAARAKLEELRGRIETDGNVVPAMEAPRRSSRELPSPLTSSEMPQSMGEEGAPSRSSTEFPWMEIEGPRISQPASMQPEILPALPPRISEPPPLARGIPPAPARKSDPTHQAPNGPAPRASGPALQPTRAAPPPQQRDMVVSTSLAPDVHVPARGSVSRAAPAAHHARTSGDAFDRGTSSGERQRAPRGPATTGSRRRSPVRLVAVMLTIVLLAGGGWLARGRIGSAPLRRTEPAEARRTPATLPNRTSAPAGAAAHQPAAKAAAALVAADEDEDDPGLTTVDIPEPSMNTRVDVDAVTSSIERATRARVDSAQQAGLQVKAPVFRKP